MADNVVDDNMDLSKLKVPDLKRELKARGLSTVGNKNELVDRLQSALKTKLDDLTSAESVDDLDDDLLNDDDLDHDETLEGSESVLTDLDEHLVDTPSEKVQKRKSQPDDQMKPIKKIILNRNPSNIDENEQNDTIVHNKIVMDSEEKKVVKISEVGIKERLEIRAKKFGTPVSTDAKRASRAERFGVTAPVSSTGTVSTGGNAPTVDALKKRAERFGGSVSTVMSKLEQQERIEKRKARFGVITAANGSASQSDKAKQRLERFKTPIK